MAAADLTSAAVRQALGAAFPTLAVASCVPLAAGWDSTAWLVNETLVFRFPLRAVVAARLRVEIALLPEVAAVLPTSIPQFRYIAERGAPTGESWPFVGYPLLAGAPLDTVPVAALAPDAPWVGQLAATLRALHQFPTARAVAVGVPARDWAGWLAHWEAFAAQTMADDVGRFTPQTRAWVTTFWAAFLAELRLVALSPVLLHHDLAPEHLLINSAGALTGIIDWGDLALGDPALDFVGVAQGCPAATLTALLAAYGPTDSRMRQRIAWYGRLGPFHRLYYGWEIAADAIVAEAVAAIEGLAASAGLAAH